MAPRENQFLYRVFYLLIDLDELPLLDRSLRLLKVNRRGFYSIRESDHISHGAVTIRENIAHYLKMNGVDETPGRILLLTLPRVLGYIFNPISVYYCFDRDGFPLAAVAEVGNTFGEWKPYLVPLTPDGSFHVRVVKHFYVSPFSDPDLEFDFRFHLPDEHLHVAIDDYREEKRELLSLLTGKRIPLSDTNLLCFSFKYPLLTLQVIFSIHWQAFLLYCRGHKARSKEAEPELQQGVYRPHKSLAKHPSSCAHSDNTKFPDTIV